METAGQNAKQVMEENDALKQLIELLNQQDMKEQSQDFIYNRVSETAARYCGNVGHIPAVNRRMGDSIFYDIRLAVDLKFNAFGNFKAYFMNGEINLL